MEEIRVSALFGQVLLMPYRWVTDDCGRLGQEYLRVEYDRAGNEVSREVLEPVAWLTWE
jgi:hypothetical protein